MNKYFIVCLAASAMAFVFLRAYGADSAYRFVERDVPTQLDFSPIPNSIGLSVATDAENHTWVRGFINEDLRGISVIFQVPSARIHDYELYVRQHGKWMHLHRNIDRRSDSFRSRFPQYAFTTADSVYYLSLGQHPPQTLSAQLEARDQFSSDESLRLFRIGLITGSDSFSRSSFTCSGGIPSSRAFLSTA